MDFEKLLNSKKELECTKRKAELILNKKSSNQHIPKQDKMLINYFNLMNK